jgi:hypothetical protein
MPRLELIHLLKPNTTPKQALLLEFIYRQFDNRSAANRRIIDVNPLYYQGVIAGTEFLVYDATKLYICYEAHFSGTPVGNINQSDTDFYNENDVICLSAAKNSMSYSVAFNYSGIYSVVNDLYFSRIATNIYNRIKFNGFRVTLI